MKPHWPAINRDDDKKADFKTTSQNVSINSRRVRKTNRWPMKQGASERHVVMKRIIGEGIDDHQAPARKQVSLHETSSTWDTLFGDNHRCTATVVATAKTAL